MHPFNPNYIYMFYAADFEENVVVLEPADPAEFNDFVVDTAEVYPFDECRKILSELGLDYAVDDPRKALIAFYQADGMAERVMTEWAKINAM